MDKHTIFICCPECKHVFEKQFTKGEIISLFLEQSKPQINCVECKYLMTLNISFYSINQK